MPDTVNPILVVFDVHQDGNDIYILSRRLVYGDDFMAQVTLESINSSINEYISVNTLKIQPDGQNINMKDGFFHVVIDKLCSTPSKITFNFENSSTEYHIECDFAPSTISGVKDGYTEMKKLIGHDVSYELLRTNPKYTGNVKVVVDSKGDLYLDTFKINQALSDEKYRKVAINPSEYYGRTIMKTFDDMSSDDFYKIEPTCFDIFTDANDFNDEIYDIYNSGVRTNGDKLYKENFAMLAPLCIRDTMPDFFLVFKVKETAYVGTDTDKLMNFFRSGELVKAFDMRKDSNLGRYIRLINEHTKGFVGDAYISYDTKNVNKFIGISLERGVVTAKYESVYDSFKADTNQIALNKWYCEGFERNRLVSKDTINLEFMFDDPSEEQFSVNTYFGVYVRANGRGEFTCIGKDPSTGEYEFYENASPVDFSVAGDVAISGFYTQDTFKRTGSSLSDSADGKLDEFIVNNHPIPRNNIASVSYSEVVDASSYMTISLNRSMKAGEHYRIVCTADASDGNYNIYEVVVSNRRSAGGDITWVAHNDFRSPDGNMRVKIHRISVMNHGEDANVTIPTDIKSLAAAFSSFENAPFEVCMCNEDSISIVSSETDIYFEKICELPGYDDEQISIISNEYSDEGMSFFGGIIPERTMLYMEDIIQYNEYLPFYPLHFAAVGDRIAYIMKFIELDGCAEISQNLTKLSEWPIVYQKDEPGYPYEFFEGVPVGSIHTDASGFVATEKKYVSVLGTDLSRYITRFDNPCLHSDRILLYDTHRITPAICSIFPVKDFYYDVLDARASDSPIVQGTNSGPISITAGEYSTLDNCYNKAMLSESEEDIKDYIISDRVFGSNSSTPLGDYINDNVRGAGVTTSSVSLMAPHVYKWRVLGTDARGSRMRLMSKLQSGNNSSMDFNFIAADSNSYYVVPEKQKDLESFLYISEDNAEKWKDIGEFDEKLKTNLGFINATFINGKGDDKFISTSLNGVILDASGDVAGTIRDYIFNGNGSFDDIIYGDENMTDRYSVVYSLGGSSVGFVSGGMLFSVSTSNKNILDITECVGYSAIFMSTNAPASDYPYPIEIFIDKIDRKLIIIWHTSNTAIGKELYVDSSVINPNIFLQQIPHTSPLSAEVVIENGEKLKTPADNSNIADASLNYILIETLPVVDNGFTKENAVALRSKCEFVDASSYAFISDASDAAVAFKGYWRGEQHNSISNEDIRNISYSYYDNITVYAISPKINWKAAPGTLDALLGDLATSNYTIYMKTAEGLEDYTGIDNLISIVRTNPYAYIKTDTDTDTYYTHGYVIPSYIEPVTKDVMSFVYSNPSMNEMFGTNFNGCNILVKDISTLPQLWIKKISVSELPYTNSRRLEYRGGYRFASFDVLKNVSIITDAWNNKLFRTYDKQWDVIEEVNPMSTGYEQQLFFASRAITLNGRRNGRHIDITKWGDGEWKDDHIVLDVTAALTNAILSSPGFMSVWNTGSSVITTSYKTNYIEKTILPLIHIDNDTIFEIWEAGNATDTNAQSSAPSQKGTPKPIDEIKRMATRGGRMSGGANKHISTVFADYTDDVNGTKLENVKNELRYENGKYLMDVYVDPEKTYTAKMMITI